MTTRLGTIKRLQLRPLKMCANLDSLLLNCVMATPSTGYAKINAGERVILLLEGKCIQFEKPMFALWDVLPWGVRGIKLRTGDQVVEMDIVRDPKADLLVIMENGGKRTPVENTVSKLVEKWVKTANLNAKPENLWGQKSLKVMQNGDILIVSKMEWTISAISSVPSRGHCNSRVYHAGSNQ